MKLFRTPVPGLVLLVFQIVAISVSAGAQGVEAGGRVPEVGLYLGESVSNTQFPAYADNAIGFNGSIYLQSASILGLEVRASTYPVSARFSQSPMTAGLRAEFTGRDLSPFVYLGGGLSYGADSGTSWRQVLAPQFYPAWQGSIGLDYRLNKMSLRLADLSMVNAYTPQHKLRTATLGAGVVIHFKP